MPAEVVAQVHCLIRQEKAKKTLTFTNTRDGNLDVLYTATKHNEDGGNHTHIHAKLTEVEGEDKDDVKDKDYDP